MRAGGVRAVVGVSRDARLGEFNSDEEDSLEVSAPSLVERLLEPITPTLGSPTHGGQYSYANVEGPKISWT